MTPHVHGILNSTNSWFFSSETDTTIQWNDTFKVLGGKEKTANRNFSIQETYNSKNEEEMKTYPDKQKWRELVGSRPALQGILKGVHQAGREGQYVSVIMWIGQGATRIPAKVTTQINVKYNFSQHPDCGMLKSLINIVSSGQLSQQMWLSLLASSSLPSSDEGIFS